MKDLTTIFWKEWREILFQPGGRSKYGILLYIAIIGIFLPLNNGADWIHSSTFISYIFVFPIVVILSIVADSFAGEKERHTLETLLASRLSDKTILFGKIGTVVSFSLCAALLPIFLGIIVVGIKYGNTNLMPFSFGLSLIAVMLIILISLFVSSLGVLVSLWASTVKQAQQAMSFGMMAIIGIIVFGFKSISKEWKEVFMNLFSGDDLMYILLKVSVSILLLDLLLIFYTLSRFKRSRLIK